jgi:DNA replication protein
MKFQGFPSHSRFTPIPDLFINQISGELNHKALRLMLIAFNLMYLKKGFPRYLSLDEFTSHPAILDISDYEYILKQLVEYGLLLEVNIANGSVVYVINNAEGQKTLPHIKNGEYKIQESSIIPPGAVAASVPDIFTTYEQNIGLITPLVAEELKDALAAYREDWIRDAIKEAVNLNKRNWKYIRRILERWSTEGKVGAPANGTHCPDFERDKYIQGRYGRIIQR